MVMRTIAPLNEEDWNKFMAGLEKGQTKAQTAIMEKAIKHAKTLHIVEY